DHYFFFAHVTRTSHKACLAAYVQINEVEVQIGGTATLPCNSSAYGREELDVQWEAMGKVVAFFQEGQLMAGQGYEGRVELQLSKALEGDFSLTLKNAVMSDTDLYLCLWQGKRDISTVTLNVLPPPLPELHTSVTEGEVVTLPCYGRIPKNKPWDKMFIQWLKDDEEILLFSSGKITTNTIYRDLSLPSQEEIRLGIYSLTIGSVRALDQGVYKCRYKANDYEAPRSGIPETYSLSVLVSQEHDEMQPTLEDASDVTEITTYSTSTELTGLITDVTEDITTMQDTTRVIAELLPQPSTTTDTTVLIADASADTTTAQDTVRVISQMLPQTGTTTDLIGLLADSSADSTTGLDSVEGYVIAELLPQPNTTTDTTVLIADGSADTTTAQDTVRVISQMLPQTGTATDLIGLLADSSADSTTGLDSVEVIAELLPQPNTTTDTTVLFADGSADSTTAQDTVRVISQMLPQTGTTTDLIGLLADSSADSTTGLDTVEEFGNVISELLLQPSTTTDTAVLIADDSADSTTVKDTIRVISQTTDLIRLLADSSAYSAIGLDKGKGEEDPFEYLWYENVPWVRITIISVVLLVTAVFFGTLVALGKL
ncbi:hypothetical protein NFI96_027541, partial [Prochilodus magdalenae]